MKKAIFLSSLNNEKQRGGAFLRVDSIRKVLQSWGIQVSTLYQDSFHPQGFFQKLLGSYKFGSEVKALFSKAHVNIEKCDFLILDNFRYLHWKFTFSDSKKPMIIYNAHNLEFENYFGKVDTPERQKFAIYEAQKMQECDLIFVCSEREKEILSGLNPDISEKVFVLPNLVDANFYATAQDNKKKWITFLGTLDYFPNMEAVEFICNEFLLSLPKELHSKIIIAGRNPTERIKSLCKTHGLTLRTNLSDSEVNKLLADTKISLVPLVSGSGTRLKIIESLFSKAMVLSTEMGAEGVNPNGLLLSDLEDFAINCTKLYGHDDFYSLCSEDSYNDYLATYDCFSWASQHRDTFLKALKLSN